MNKKIDKCHTKLQNAAGIFLDSEANLHAFIERSCNVILSSPGVRLNLSETVETLRETLSLAGVTVVPAVPSRLMPGWMTTPRSL